MRYLAYLDRVFGDYRFSYEAIKYNNIENSRLINIFGHVSNILGSDVTQYVFLLFIFAIGGICSWILSSKLTKNRLLRALFTLFWLSTPWLYSRGMRGQVRNMVSYMLIPLVVYIGWVYYDRPGDKQILSRSELMQLLKMIVISGFISITNIRYVPIVCIWFVTIIISKVFKDNYGYGYQSIFHVFTKKTTIKTISKIVVYIIGIGLISLYWILPFYNSIGDIQFNIQDFNYFSPKGDWYNIIWQLITMSGQADENWMLLYKSYLSSLTNVILSFIFLIILIYASTQIKIDGFKKVVLGFFIFALMFGSGSSLFILGDINTFFVRYVPGFTFYREPGKWLIWIVALYGIFIWSWLDGLYTSKRYRYINIIGLIFIGVYIINNIYFYVANGFSPDRYILYPKGRYEARDRLSSNISTQDEKTISLPWHWYLRCDFTNGKIIQNPVGVFFGPDVIYGDNIEAGGIYTNIDSSIGLFFEDWYDDPKYYYDNPELFLQGLRSLGVKNILWLKDDCAKGDRMIDFINKFDQASLSYYKVFENGSIRVYDISR